MAPTEPYLTFTGIIPTADNATNYPVQYEGTILDVQITTPTTAFVIGTSFIAILPLVFLLSVILAFYISLTRHQQQNTYGLAPVIVVTGAKGRRKSSHRTLETTVYSDYSRYSTCDGHSASGAQSDWSINTSVNAADEREDRKPSNLTAGNPA